MEGFEQRSDAERLTFETSGSGCCEELEGSRGEPPAEATATSWYAITADWSRVVGVDLDKSG